jgi:multiple sugar transport system permease protein
VAFIQIWMWYGYTTIILISGVLGINPELFESAAIDGATASQTFFPHHAALHAHDLCSR